jgi:LysR family glycine cleavage system transcriptional activator
LKTLQNAHPDIDLHVITSTALTNFSRDGVDVAIRHGYGRYPGLHSEHLLTVEVVPVAAPVLVAQWGLPNDPAELRRWPLVHDADRKGWHLWFQARRIDEIGPPRGPSFDDSSLLLRAVLDGQGAGLLPAAMLERDLAEGRLVKLADIVWIDDFAYYLVYPAINHERPKVAAFRAWILDALVAESVNPSN